MSDKNKGLLAYFQDGKEHLSLYTLRFHKESLENEWTIETINNQRPVMFMNVCVATSITVIVMILSGFEKHKALMVARWAIVVLAALCIYIMFYCK